MYADDSIHIEKTDQCYTCEYFLKGVMCPLLEALALGVVELSGDMTVQNCGFYKEFKRHLHVVDSTAADLDSAASPSTDNDDNDDDSHQEKSWIKS